MSALPDAPPPPHSSTTRCFGAIPPKCTRDSRRAATGALPHAPACPRWRNRCATGLNRCAPDLCLGVGESSYFSYMMFLPASDGDGSRFATTIHILVSAVVKLMRAVRLPAGLPLYRGLGGTTALPESFYRADGNGCRGYTEWSFLSTTSSMAVAVEVRRVLSEFFVPCRLRR